MNSRRLLASSLACLSVALAPQFVAAQGIASNPPPLLPGEYIVKTRNGCSLIVTDKDLNSFANIGTASIEALATQDWSGQCRDGLVHGWGQLSGESIAGMPVGYGTEYFLGRAVSVQVRPSIIRAGKDVSYFDRKTGQRARSDGRDDPFAPVWSKSISKIVSLHDPLVVAMWSTEQSDCMIDPERFKDCDINRPYDVYGISYTEEGGKRSQRYWCPNPKTSEGCETLWREKTAVTAGRIKEIAANARRQDIEERAQWMALTAPWLKAKLDARIAIALAAVRKDAGAAGPRPASAAAPKTAGTREKPDSAFTASLSNQDPHQLFHLANSKLVEGDFDKGRAALRNLIVRFPNHILAGMAKQVLDALPADANTAVGATEVVGSVTSAKAASPMQALATAMGLGDKSP